MDVFINTAPHQGSGNYMEEEAVEMDDTKETVFQIQQDS